MLVLLAGGAARAAPATGVDIAWTAPGGCPDAAVRVRLLADHLGRPPGARDRLIAIVRIEQRERDFLARIVVRGPARRIEREVAGAGCVTVTDAAALVLALAVEQQAAIDLATAAPPPAPQPAARPTRVESGPAPRVALAASLLVGGRVGTGMLPEADLGVSAGLAIGRGDLWMELEGTSWIARELDVAGGGAEIDAETAAVRGCWRPRVWVPCAALELGRVRGQGQGFEDADAGAALWLAVTPGLGVAVSLGDGWYLSARAEVAVTLSAPRFTMAGAPVHAPGHLIGRLTAGIAVPLL